MNILGCINNRSDLYVIARYFTCFRFCCFIFSCLSYVLFTYNHSLSFQTSIGFSNKRDLILIYSSLTSGLYTCRGTLYVAHVLCSITRVLNLCPAILRLSNSFDVRPVFRNQSSIFFVKVVFRKSTPLMRNSQQLSARKSNIFLSNMFCFVLVIPR